MKPELQLVGRPSCDARPSICFVMPYFGAWPWWMPFFIESCRSNPDIDWLFFSDCGEIEACPPNIRLVPTGYREYCARVSRVLDIDFAPANPYKLCDIRPAFGCIHQDELRGYDFWAFGDIDLVFGDLRAYFTPERMAGKDLLSTHARRISGHCTLIRNNDRMRAAFLLMPHWRQRFCDAAHQALDEGAFSHIFIRRKSWPTPLFKLAALFNPWWRRAEFTEAYSTPGAKVDWIGGGRDFPSRWYWRNGRLSNDRDGERCFPYFHFIVWKKNEWEKLSILSKAELQAIAATRNWVIDAHGFHALSS